MARTNAGPAVATCQCLRVDKLSLGSPSESIAEREFMKMAVTEKRFPTCALARHAAYSSHKGRTSSRRMAVRQSACSTAKDQSGCLRWRRKVTWASS